VVYGLLFVVAPRFEKFVLNISLIQLQTAELSFIKFLKLKQTAVQTGSANFG